MGLLDRPYVGTFVPNQRKIIQWTPDALVYLNGDTSLSGCRICHHNIDIQQFVTSLSVDAGVEPGASSASISLSIPRHFGDSIFRDGNTLLRNALEVHIYIRGYFPMTGLTDPDADPNANRIAGVNLADIPQYPYYPVFHGVVTNVNHEYSGGYYSASLSCSGMLHFWQYMQVASNGSYFGARPNNSGVRTTLRGHIFTGMSPFSIIYSLYRDTVGAAGGVGFALGSRTNMQAVSTATGDSLYSMALQYWERRFAQGMYGLRMHGASGQLFSGAQQAYLARLNGNDARILSTVTTGTPRQERDPLVLQSAAAFNLIDRDGDGRILRGADLRFLASASERRSDYGVVVPQMQAFVNDISQWGQVNLFETTYETKLDIATQVANICGYEFFQDMDGDLVFKPPLYNLDTSSSRVYRIEPEDIINIAFTENEPEATYATVSAGPFQNLRGAVDQAEWGVRSTYYDYRLIAQFGWREGSLESNYYSNARSAFYAAVAQLDRLNQGMNSASLTIPLRPEIRPGFPVYIPHIDCFYYVQSVSHGFAFGGGCTTTLNLSARRRKFIPPGDPAGSSVSSINLAQTSLPPRPLQYLDNSSVPRILGFPNVVMALDPERINPLFFFLGLDAEESGLRTSGAGQGTLGSVAARQELLASNFAQILVSAGLLGFRVVDPVDQAALASQLSDENLFGILDSSSSSTPTATVTSEAPVTATTMSREEMILGPWWIQTGPARGQQISPQDLRRGLVDLISVRGRVRGRIATVNNQIRNLQQQERASSISASQRDTLLTQIAGLRTEVTLLNNFLFDETGNQSLASLQENDSHVSFSGVDLRLSDIVNFLINRVRILNPATGSRDMSLDGTGAINDSATLLDLLNDRKASLNLNTPGYYRYYSSAHPDPEQQGYTPITSASSPTATTGDSDPTATTVSDEAGASEPNLTAVGIESLTGEDTRDLQVNLSDDQRRDFVKLVNKIPVNGLNVRTFSSHDPTPVPTDQIFALSFEQRTASRVGRTTIFEFPDSITTAQLISFFRSCLSGRSTLGRALGNRLTDAASNGSGGLTNAAETGGALVTRAVSGIQNLVFGTTQDNSPIDSDDISSGTPNNRAVVDGTVVTDTALGSLNTAARARTILQNKGNALIQQVSEANRAAIERAITLISTNSPVTTTTGTPSTDTVTPATPPAPSDVRLAAQLSEGHGMISPDVIRATRAVESGVRVPNPSAVRIEYARLERDHGIVIDHADGVPPRQVLDQALAQYPSQTDTIMGLTSFGYYQVLGNTLQGMYPDTASALQAFDSNPVGVSDSLLSAYLDQRPAVRQAMIDVSADPSTDNIDHLNHLYSGAALDSEQLDRRRDRFTTALSDPSIGTPRGRGGSPTPTHARTGFSGSVAQQLSGALSLWRQDLQALFQGHSISGLPFTIRTDVGLVEEPINTFSPVFPVSDAVGYEHYGTYQYGRGLSIESGGNYQTLMGTDPFQYVDPDLAYRFADAVRRSGVTQGEDGPSLGPAAQAAIHDIASDAQFSSSPGADIAIRVYHESHAASETEDRTAAIESGLATYILSSRDAITHLPVSNVAFRLTDLTPFEETDTCECRGAEADLLLGAYMSGVSSQTFVSVDNASEQVAQWVLQQMVLAADSWTISQSALRGATFSTQSRTSAFDSVRGILGIASTLTTTTKQFGTDISNATDPTSQNIRRLNQIAGRIA
jgi:hypothetical protein